MEPGPTSRCRLTAGLFCLALITMAQPAPARAATTVSADIRITAYVAPSSCRVAVDVKDGRAEELPGCVAGVADGNGAAVILGGPEEPVELVADGSTIDVI